MESWIDIEKEINTITAGGKFYFTMGQIEHEFYCLIYRSSDLWSPVIVVNREKSLKKAVVKAINEYYGSIAISYRDPTQAYLSTEFEIHSNDNFNLKEFIEKCVETTILKMKE